MGTYRTFFDIAGVPAEASRDEIELAFQEAFAAAGAQRDQIGNERINAFEFLLGQNNAEQYRVLLDYCRSHENIDIPFAAQPAFERFCRACYIDFGRHPEHPEVYQVRHPGQTGWTWETHDPAKNPALRPPVSQRASGWFRRYFLGDVFRNRTAPEQVAIAIAYFLVIGLVVYATQTAKTRITEYQESEARRVAKEFSDKVAAQGARLAKKVAELERDFSAWEEDFTSTTNLSIEQASEPSDLRPRVLDLALVRHKSVRDAWDNIVNGPRPATLLASIRTRYSEVASHISAARISTDDVEQMNGIEQDLVACASRLDALRASLTHIREMRDADKFEANLESKHGSSP